VVTGQRGYADIDAVTLDAYGTLVRLVDPMDEIGQLLRARGVDRSREQIAAAFEAEAVFYSAHTVRGGDAETLRSFREDSASVFLDSVGAGLDPGEFAPAYVEALRFEVIPGVIETLERLRLLGVELAVVANWDISVHEQLARFGLASFFRTIVSSAEVGVMKPDATIFHVALERLGIPPDRAMHVGDHAVDEAGARAAGMRFAWTPLSSL
jgi:2-haloalkanoic acid dehalogenase type II